MTAVNGAPSRAVLLDLDGTLIDSGPGIIACAEDAFRAVGLPVPSASALRAFVGPPIRESLLNAGVPPAELDRAISGFRTRFSEASISGSTLYAGVVDALTQLRAMGFRLVVATSKPSKFAVPVCEHFGLDAVLSGVFGSSSDGPPTSKAAVIAEAFAACGGVPAVVVGDRRYDVMGARANGLECLGVGWGYAEPGELAEAGAASIVTSVSELPGAVVDVFEWRKVNHLLAE